MMDDEVYRLWKLTRKYLKALQKLSCSVSSKGTNYSMAVRDRKDAHKKRHEEYYEKADLKVRKRKNILNKERSKYQRIEARYRRAQENLQNFIYNASDIVGDYRHNFCIEFNVKQYQIDIFFGGTGPCNIVGKHHGHCGLHPVTLKPKFTTRYPGDPHPPKIKQKKYYEFSCDLE